MQGSAEQIADQLRELIRTGQLGPGDRVPSIRALMRDHEVAMATASKVIAQLRDEGWVVTRPGHGTVVARVHRVRQRAQPREVTIDAVIAAAVTVADREGLEAVSIRRLASELVVSPMGLHRRVVNKAELVDRMVEYAFDSGSLAEVTDQVGQQDHWRRRLEAAAEALWVAYRRHPWLAAAMSTTRPPMITAALPYSELVLGAFADAGCTAREGFTLHLVLLNLIRGLAVTLEPEAEEEARTGMDNDEWMDLQLSDMTAAMPGERYPHLTEIMTRGYPYDVDAIFRGGLRSFLDGVAWRGRS